MFQAKSLRILLALFEVQQRGYWLIWWLHMGLIGYFFYSDLTLRELNLWVLLVLILPYIILFLYARFIGAESRLIGSYRRHVIHDEGNKAVHRFSYAVLSFLVASSFINVMPVIGSYILVLMGLFILLFLFFEFIHFKVIEKIAEYCTLIEVPLTADEILEQERKRREREQRAERRERVTGDPNCWHDWHEYTLGQSTHKRRCNKCSRREFKFRHSWVLDD